MTERSIEICKIMLRKRGYKNIVMEDDIISARRQNNVLNVYFDNNDKFKTDSLKRCISIMSDNDIKHCSRV